MQPLTVRMELARLVHCSSSMLNGDILVEDIIRENAAEFVIRRMRFVSNLALEQCEVRFISTQEQTAEDSKCPLPESNDAPKLTIDTSYLAYECVRGMCLALALLPRAKRPGLSASKHLASLKSMSIGLAGGALPTFLRHNVAGLRVDCVEIDGTVVELAMKFFGLAPDDQLKVVVQDALELVQQTGDAAYDLILM